MYYSLFLKSSYNFLYLHLPLSCQLFIPILPKPPFLLFMFSLRFYVLFCQLSQNYSLSTNECLYPVSKEPNHVLNGPWLPLQPSIHQATSVIILYIILLYVLISGCSPLQYHLLFPSLIYLRYFLSFNIFYSSLSFSKDLCFHPKYVLHLFILSSMAKLNSTCL